ncbi:hypothetical protein FO519_009774 [Halicephalobus sp. NKZ332]|nr:hypothetical protein FO519_009774 [Halicephalobus sp. NKZ332]
MLKWGSPPPQTGTCGPERTAQNEAVCLCCYYDTKRIPTIGIGFNLNRADAGEMMERYHLKLEDVKQDCVDGTEKHCMTSDDVYDLFTIITYPEFGRYADDYVPGLPPIVRAAVIDVAFAGYGKLKNESKFPHFRDDLRKGNWKAAADDLKKTGWCKDVKSGRCNSDSNCIANECNGKTCDTYTIGLTALLRSNNEGVRDHLYTISVQEQQNAVNQGYVIEDHFYTIIEEEKNKVEQQGYYHYEGIQCYIWQSNSVKGC